jgi:hypothetical protein
VHPSATTHFPLLKGPVAVNLVNTLVSDRPGRDLLGTSGQLRDWLRSQTPWIDASGAPGARLDDFRVLTHKIEGDVLYLAPSAQDEFNRQEVRSGDSKKRVGATPTLFR